MAVLTNTMLQGTAADTGDGDDYQIERSLKFNKAESAHLTRTPNRPGNQRTWTYATWFKRIDPGTKQIFFGISNAGSGYAMSVELASDEIYVYIGEDAATYYVSSSKYRDPSAWYHLVVAYDSNQPRVKDRIRVYINGETVPNPTTNAAPTVVVVAKSKLTGVTEFSERPVNTTIVFFPTISEESAAETVKVTDCSPPGDNVLLVHV